jgi:hypothetical protein
MDTFNVMMDQMKKLAHHVLTGTLLLRERKPFPVSTDIPEDLFVQLHVMVLMIFVIITLMKIVMVFRSLA